MKRRFAASAAIKKIGRLSENTANKGKAAILTAVRDVSGERGAKTFDVDPALLYNERVGAAASDGLKRF